MLTLVDNPAYAGRTPRPLEVECHDRTPFITVACQCGYQLHLHESQIDVPRDVAIATRCHECGDVLEARPGFFHEAFDELRQHGWLASRADQ